MRPSLFAVAALILGLGSLCAQDSRPASLSDFTVMDLKGRPVTFSPTAGETIAVVFFSTRCPMSNSFNYRRNTLYNDFKDRVRFVVVDPNANESVEEIADYARGVEFDFPVFKDTNNALADRLGAQMTTDSFVIDSTGAVRYHGHIEDSPNPARTHVQGLRRAIEAVIAGKQVALPETKATGCAIRRTRPSVQGAPTEGGDAAR